ncbi:pyridoxamine 5'-phosphate oxidase family protein [Bacillus massilinigeriensis]|uniref:pyridoxamine 5'-phosphate oxidase family protein n=1 Tax=Bacillus massilionigeriensis TaxID=1805475 RepID=UPI00096AE10A|nr:pyridoxamine 5'-phosphate oxidase family protein [Bacillus massilionigeriensis]
MPNRIEPKLITPLYEILQKEHFCTIATVDYETNGPNVNSISWVFACDDMTLLFAVDNRSRIVLNIKHNEKIVLHLIANESTYSISGDAVIKVEKIDGIPIKLALIEMKINEVRDVMFYGSKISVEPKYDKTYDKVAAERLDKQVMNALKREAQMDRKE